MLKVQIRALEVKTAAVSRQFVVLLDDRFFFFGFFVYENEIRTSHANLNQFHSFHIRC